MALDNVNHSPTNSFDANQINGYQEQRQKEAMRAHLRPGEKVTFQGRSLLPGSAQGNLVLRDAQEPGDSYRHIRSAGRKTVLTPGSDAQVGEGVNYWSVSKELAGRLKGAEANAAEILSTMRELVKYNGKTMAEACKVAPGEVIKLPEHYKRLQG